MGNLINFGKDTLIYGLGDGLKKFIGIFLLPFYTRALSPADYGLLDTLATFSFFISAIIGVGIDSASGYYFFEVKDEEKKGKILYTTFILRLLTTVPSLVLSIFSQEISVFLFDTTNYTWLVFISCITIPVSFMLSEQSTIYRLFRQPWKFNLITILKSVGSIGLGITLVVVLRWGVLGAMLAALISSLVVIIFSFFYFTKYKYNYSFSWEYAKKMLIFGYPLIWAGVAQWVYVSSDRFFLLSYRNLTEIGYYSMGSIFSQPINLLNAAIQTSFGVLFWDMYHKEQEPKTNSKKFSSDAFKIYVVTATIISVFLSIFSTNLINFITTPAYIMGSLAVPLLTFSVVFAQGQQIVSPGITISKKTWHYSWLVSVAAIINIGLNFYFVPRWGFVGAGFTTVISYFAYFIGCYFISQRYLKVNFNLIRILIFVFFAFTIAFLVPYSELKTTINIAIFYKILLLGLTFLLPFLLGLITFRQIVLIKEKLLVLVKQIKGQILKR
ncbi:MAG: polysaccharide biosynthesis C-terminal domain-containing protein [Ignavibacterium sp.]|nr:polysaccharide biosynthesis C-terminal domain-containing protein [Ignavibacterium sp.]